MFLNCKLCKKQFKTYPCRIKKNHSYCSVECYHKDWKNVHPHSWNKGKKLHYTVWNKGTKGVCKPNKTSFKKGQRPHNYNGGLSFYQNRWWVICKGDKKIPFARVVLENQLMRKINPRQEIIHHINENPSDDRPENLMIVTRSEHINIHRKQLLKARRKNYELKRSKTNRN